MADILFDSRTRGLRRDRAFRHGPELFLHERAFGDCLERLSFVQRRFRSALLIGCPDATWPARLGQVVAKVQVVDPGSCFAGAAGGACILEDQWSPPQCEFDLCLAIGTLDTVNDLPGALQRLRSACRPDSLLLGAMAGGHSLPRLRNAMRAADQFTGSASPHIHPRIEASALAALLTSAGLVMPVVDIDRVAVSYESLHRLVQDLRRMGATNILGSRSSTPISRGAYEAAVHAFALHADQSRTTEMFEILHFAGWTPSGKG